MIYTILVYGATGYAGRLIAAEGKHRNMCDGSSGYRMVLGGRSAAAVKQLAEELEMDYRVFGLDHEKDAEGGLAGIDVVINAATPFALTADCLAKTALRVGCGYVDINGQLDVYTRLQELGRHAQSRQIPMVCSVGHTAAASGLLLHVALCNMPPLTGPPNDELGAVRIAASRLLHLSRGSIETLLNSVREQVTVVRLREKRDRDGRTKREDVLWHEPVGKLERMVDFGVDDYTGAAPAQADTATRPRVRIASAVNLVDTLTARLTVRRSKWRAHTIESYAELGTLGRIAYQSGSWFTPFAAMQWVRDLTHAQVSLLPAGPSEGQRNAERHTVVLEIEDPCEVPRIVWRWHTTNPYDFTARVVVEVARRVAPGSSPCGWLTPSEVLEPTLDDLTSEQRVYFRGCRLERAPVV
jgi:short subunit dehydrogenase-like uncharacterized protein